MAEKTKKSPKPEPKAEKGGQKEKGAKGTSSSGKLEKISLRLKEKYLGEVAPAMKERFKYANVMMIPRLEKVVVNMGLGEAIANPKILDAAVADLAAITGQRPVVTKSKKAISNFKLRAGVKIGAKVTLRGPKMWAFLDKLFNLVLPRIRDFRGLSAKSFDGRGNYSFGLKEQIIFPEIDYDKVDRVRGMDICIVTTAKNDEEGAEFLRLLGCPIRKQ
ncbi:MAG: 50S ribosomal protein L5 [Candidatus Eremiobacterota bacterium]